jgi:hypothetical protein
MNKSSKINLRKLEAVPGTVFSYKGNQYVAKEDPIFEFACNRCAFRPLNCSQLIAQGKLPSCKSTKVHYVKVGVINGKKDQKA